ncbi:hypothetical protein VE03_07081 [Pseudogymnoascus sp. 23342-1-I1]|nr:hypothetical protein VE03_07081 [Pseudogymnoascus sp. 23342-1-I1]
MASQSTIALPEHVTLPFDLRTDPEAFHKPENIKLLRNLFPGNCGLSMDGMFLIFLQTKMPPKPWPKSVAGLPPYFAPRMGRQYIPGLIGEFVRMRNGSIVDDINGRDMVDWEPLFYIVMNHFREIGVSITEVMYWRDYVAVILQHRRVDTARLPQKVANIAVSYCYEDGNQPQLLRTLTPAKGRRTDDSVFLDSYDTGFIEGSFKVTSFQRVIAGEGSSEQQWVFTIWLYMGQDSADALPPVYGRAIFTVDGCVLGFARYAPENGQMKNWCSGVAADEFIDRLHNC